MKATEAILAGVFAGGGSGGGTSGVLAIRTDPDTGEFDCTFREILAALDAGKFVFTLGLNPDDEYERVVDDIVDTYFNPDDGSFHVVTNGGSDYWTDSLDGYPTP